MNQISCNDIFIILIAFIFVSLEFIPSNFLTNEDRSNTKPKLFIAIISARSNIDKRESIRKTWGQLANKESSIELKFFIGKECPIPIEDRIERLICDEAMAIQYGNLSSEEENTDGNLICSTLPALTNVPSLLNVSFCFIGFGFQVLHPIQISSIGILSELFEDFEHLEVVFKDPEEVLEKITFKKDACSFTKKNLCFISLKTQFILPRHFEGEISVVSKEDIRTLNKHCMYVNHYVRFTFGKSIMGIEKVHKGSCFYITFQFTVLDRDALKKRRNQRPFRQLQWMEKQEGLRKQLKDESEKYGDTIHLCQIIDTYGNLPQKVLEVFKWAHINFHKSSVLKVDDDIYLNVAFLTRLIADLKFQDDSLFWSHFHYHRIVPLFGKASDPAFQALTYPPFPSGSGYLISGSIVSLFAEKTPFLKLFQGEDVSMGIWSEVLQLPHREIQKHHVRCWLPSSYCNESLIIPQLTPEQILFFHQKLNFD